MVLTKKQIIKNISKQLCFSQAKTAAIVEDLLDIIKLTFSNNEDILISNFGKFCVIKKKSRIGRNPFTAKDMVIKKRKVITFKSSTSLKKLIDDDK